MQNKVFKICIGIVLLTAILPSVVFAGPLSQLYFDTGRKGKPATTSATTSDKIQQLLEKENLSPEEQNTLKELRMLMGDDTPLPEKESEVPKETSKLKLETQTVELLEAESFIPPQLSGPQTDLNNSAKITSEATWVPMNNSCLDFSKMESVCSHAKALQEVIFRFSGEEDFFEGLCPEFCEEGEVAVVTDLELTEDNQVKIRSLAQGRSCAVSMQLTGPRWLVIKAKTLECSCVARSCVS